MRNVFTRIAVGNTKYQGFQNLVINLTNLEADKSPKIKS